MEFVFGLENGHFQNASDQKSDTTSEDQLFVNRNFAFRPIRNIAHSISNVPDHGSAKDKLHF